MEFDDSNAFEESLRSCVFYASEVDYYYYAISYVAANTTAF